MGVQFFLKVSWETEGPGPQGGPGPGPGPRPWAHGPMSPWALPQGPFVWPMGPGRMGSLFGAIPIYYSLVWPYYSRV